MLPTLHFASKRAQSPDFHHTFLFLSLSLKFGGADLHSLEDVPESCDNRIKKNKKKQHHLSVFFTNSNMMLAQRRHIAGCSSTALGFVIADGKDP